jgi:hypothetical protein
VPAFQQFSVIFRNQAKLMSVPELVPEIFADDFNVRVADHPASDACDSDIVSLSVAGFLLSVLRPFARAWSD